MLGKDNFKEEDYEEKIPKQTSKKKLPRKFLDLYETLAEKRTKKFKLYEDNDL